MNKKTVAILGATGMLGSAVYATMKDRYNLVLVVRNRSKLALLNKKYGDVNTHRIIELNIKAALDNLSKTIGQNQNTHLLPQAFADILDADAVVNCIGITDRCAEPLDLFSINGGLPHMLSSVFGDRLIHISTDAVFDGLHEAPYSESAIPRPDNLYGLSKLMGEASAHSLVFRTSIIGPEIDNHASLLEWVKKQHDTIRGYRKSMWNGITTFEFARICGDIIENRALFPRSGLYHLFSTDVSKYEMIIKIARIYGVKVHVDPDDSIQPDRRLSSQFNICKQLDIPSFDEMLAKLPL